MRQQTHAPSYARRTVLPVALVLASLAVSHPAAAEPGAGDARYDAYVGQEAAEARAKQGEAAGSQTASTGDGSAGGIVTYSQQPNSPYALGNAAQHEQGR